MNLSNCSGISHLDIKALRLCHSRRIHKYKTFKEIAKRGLFFWGDFTVLNFMFFTNDKG
ncbi:MULTISPECIES: transposase [Chryseobacterium]|uniref:Transposase DDE domain-containing protein n=1 Tax=Chryseobacterium candidae TaxID=1978493 RepID=A0ABY2RCK0_9FLAO|nr:hypothetical protein EK417_02485 [Chryseobacterium candidae]